MKKFLLPILVTFFANNGCSQTADSVIVRNPLMASLNTLTAVRLIIIGDKVGTCFIANYKTGQYLITVKHLFDTNKKKNGDTVNFSISDKKGMLRFNYRVFFHLDSNVDIAVISIPANFLPNNQLRISEDENCFLGQDCYFLGYPLGLSSLIDSVHYPLYKKAVFSGILDLKRGLNVYDAHNNRGFSGAPIITTNSTYDRQYVAGIVSGYRNEVINIEANSKNKNEPFVVNENSGIMEAYDATNVIQIILWNGLR
jgi:hypothetical protein